MKGLIGGEEEPTKNAFSCLRRGVSPDSWGKVCNFNFLNWVGIGNPDAEFAMAHISYVSVSRCCICW